MFLVYTNVLLDVFTDDATWRSWSEQAVRAALVTGSVGINPIIYAEVSLAFADAGFLDRSLNALMLARMPLPDFYIGAHAAADNLTLVTSDVGRYRTYFPSLKLIAPNSPKPK